MTQETLNPVHDRLLYPHLQVALLTFVAAQKQLVGFGGRTRDMSELNKLAEAFELLRRAERDARQALRVLDKLASERTGPAIEQ